METKVESKGTLGMILKILQVFQISVIFLHFLLQRYLFRSLRSYWELHHTAIHKL